MVVRVATVAMVITHIQRGVIAACAVVSLVSAAFMPDYTGRDISMEYDD